MADSTLPKTSNLCASCGSKLKGNFCSQCGERKLNPDKDYSLHKFIEQTVDGFTHFDTKFVRSFRALIFKPGFLTSEFINGRRTRYMKPIQIFIIASVLFYFFFPTASTFYAPVNQLQTNDRFGFNADKAIEEKSKSDNMSISAVVSTAEKEAAHRSKAYLFLLIPFWGALFYALFWRSSRFLVPHIIFATHNISFLIVLFIIYYPLLFVLRIRNIGDAQLTLMALIYFFYLFLAIRKTYQRQVIWSFVKTTISFAGLIGLFIIYREGITIWVLNE